MLKKSFFVITVLSAVILSFSCSDRNKDVVSSTIDVRQPNDVNLEFNHVYSTYLNFSMFSDIASSPIIESKVYFPEGYALDGSQLVNLPVLYLLSPFRGNAGYYFSHGLVAVADRLIAAGEIVPMFIVCVDGSHGYGASFYGDSWSGGRYAAAVGEITGSYINGSIVDYTDNALRTDASRAMRAISGFGLGGYGAMRIAMEYNENFGSVSAVAGPLDFDGASGSGGFIPLFQSVIDELTIDEMTFKSMKPDLTRPVRTMLMGGACSFSPHVEYGDVQWNDVDIWANETFVFDDTMTLIYPEGVGSDISFHMPFDENGELYDTVWNLWLNNNLPVMLQNNPGALDSTSIQLFSVSDDAYGFNQQTEDFADFLTTHLAGRDIVFDASPVVFNGYNGYDANISHFVYDILPEILKFHSAQFEAAEE